MKNNNKGFTLIEILVVVLIISILAGIVAVSVFQHPAKAKIAAAKLQIKIFQSALSQYYLDNDTLPTQEQGLEALCCKPVIPPIPKNYNPDGYLECKKIPKDPWGNDYVYLVPGSHGERYEIISYGRDGKPGGSGEDADISSSDL